MCGLCGFLDYRHHFGEAQLRRTALAMGEAMAHRGPDASTVWVDPVQGVALGHRRLSIVDLTPTGAQPMTSSKGDLTIVLNGEIYNYEELRTLLEREGVVFRGTSDTEVLLEGLARWGMEKTLGLLVGMFAFALWDGRNKTLSLARDRAGEKPLYYGWMGDTFLFGSDLRALREHPHFESSLNYAALGAYFQYNYIPAPLSIYEGIAKLPPGTWGTLALEDPRREFRTKTYWSLEETVRQARENPFRGSPQEVVEELERLLAQSLKGQMIAHVPLGAFLSGGIDSSLVVGAMQRLSSSPVETFTIGFEESSFDEAAEAGRVARHLGTNHHTHYVSPKEALDVVPHLPRFYSEPLGDSSQIPTYLVAHFAKKHVTVALSGDGGDELFGGYNRHQWLPRLEASLGKYPLWARSFCARGLQSLSPFRWDTLLTLGCGITRRKVPRLGGYKVHKLARLLTAKNEEDLYGGATPFWDTFQGPLKKSLAREEFRGLEVPVCPEGLAGPERVMFRDFCSYLPGDILAKVDRACMGASLEGRAPLLDHRLVAFAWSLPLEYRIFRGVGKWPLRKLLEKYVPRELTERPKMGFGVPVSLWIRGPLKEWAQDLLAPARLKQEGLLDVPTVQQRLNEHLSGRFDHSDSLWGLLMFQQWRETYGL